MATIKQKQSRLVAFTVVLAILLCTGAVLLNSFVLRLDSSWIIYVIILFVVVPLIILMHVWMQRYMLHDNNKLSCLIYRVKLVEARKISDVGKINELKNKFLDFVKTNPELQGDAYRYLADLEFATFDTEAAMQHYSEALNRTPSDTDDYLYMINRRATGLMRLGSYQAALKDYEYVAQNNPFYSREYAMIYEFGWGVERDLEKSCQLYEQAARHGNDLAVVNLYENRWRMAHPVPSADGYAEYMKKCFSQEGYMAGVPELTASAEAGYAPSQYELGTLFKEGLLGANKRAEAFTWLKRGADQHYLPAMHNLGFLEDYNVGMAIILEAAEQGYAPSQHSIGCSYWQRLNRDDATKAVDEDSRRSLSQEERDKLTEESKLWLKRAIDQGYKNAVNSYEAFFGKLPAD